MHEIWLHIAVALWTSRRKIGVQNRMVCFVTWRLHWYFLASLLLWQYIFVTLFHELLESNEIEELLISLWNFSAASKQHREIIQTEGCLSALQHLLHHDSAVIRNPVYIIMFNYRVISSVGLYAKLTGPKYASLLINWKFQLSGLKISGVNCINYLAVLGE